MATTNLLPGLGGRADITTALTSGAAAATTDSFDVSRCTQFAVQAKTWAAGNLVVQVQHSIDGTNYANLGAATTMVVGDILRFGSGTGPYGLVRYSLTSSDTTASVTLTITGYPTVGNN